MLREKSVSALSSEKYALVRSQQRGCRAIRHVNEWSLKMRLAWRDAGRIRIEIVEKA